MSETKVNLGFLPVNRGTYSNSATYYKDNIVQYNGSSYICTQDPGSGATPQGITGEVPYVSQPDVPNTHWAVFVNNQGGPVEGIYDVSANHVTDNTPKAYESLSEALADVPTAKKTGGLVIKFIQTTPATYNVVKTEGVTELPTGTLLDSASSIASGTYTASQLSDFSTLPTTSAVTYYVAVTEDETTTYTTWVITLASAESKEYVQYRLMLSEFTAAQFTNANNWQGIDSEPTAGSRNLVESSGVAAKTQIYDNIVDTYQSVNLFDKSKVISGYVSRIDGTIHTDTDYFTTDYISIDSFGVYAALAVTGGSFRGYACYSDKNESSFTHGYSSRQAVFGEGDNYVRFSGLLTDIDAFMAVKGTSSSYPSEYVPYGLLGKLKNNSVGTEQLKDNSITTSKITDNSITIGKTAFKEQQIISTNLLNTNDPQYIHEQGYYINKDTGEEKYSSSTTTRNYGRTGFIPVSEEGLYCNAFASSGNYAGGAVYDANKQYLRGTTAQYTYQDGDAYVRFTLAQTPVNPFYTSDQLMVWKGTSSLNPTYDVYTTKEVIVKDVLPKFNPDDIPDNGITYSKLNDDVTSKILVDGVEICIPNIVPCVVGETLMIYFRSIVKAPNPYIWDCVAISSVGKSYPRYYEYKPTAAGNNTVTFYVRNSAGVVVAQKAITIKCITATTSPSTNKNILVLGASLCSDGEITNELNRRLTSNTGDGTPFNPTGLGLTNINFVGRLTGSSHPEIHQEARGGWSWDDYITNSRNSFRFYVTGTDELKIGDTYRDADSHYTFEIIEINVTDGSGNIRCSKNGSGTIANSGTLTLVNGSGDSSITYTSYEEESGNPFWNNTTDGLDFISYANQYCNGQIDIIISFVLANDLTKSTEEEIESEIIEGRVKVFARALHEQLPNCKLVLFTGYLGSVGGGMAASYGASSAWNYYTTARKEWKWSELVREMAADEEFSSYVIVTDTLSSFDCENLYPTGNRTVANRSESIEVVQTNGIHPTANGKKTIADSVYNTLNDIL